jgi:hypothetical protein
MYVSGEDQQGENYTRQQAVRTTLYFTYLSTAICSPHSLSFLPYTVNFILLLENIYLFI